MDTPRDNLDRLMKRMLGRPRVVRDLLALLPSEWTAAVDASVLRELPTEFIGGRGDKRVADLCWLAGGDPAGTGGFGGPGTGREDSESGRAGPGGFGGRGADPEGAGGFEGRGGGPAGAGADKEGPGGVEGRGGDPGGTGADREGSGTPGHCPG